MMMRPFISSLGSGTTDTVASLEWSAAQRATAWLMSLAGHCVALVLGLRLERGDVHCLSG